MIKPDSALYRWDQEIINRLLHATEPDNTQITDAARLFCRYRDTTHLDLVTDIGRAAHHWGMTIETVVAEARIWTWLAMPATLCRIGMMMTPDRANDTSMPLECVHAAFDPPRSQDRSQSERLQAKPYHCQLAACGTSPPERLTPTHQTSNSPPVPTCRMSQETQEQLMAKYQELGRTYAPVERPENTSPTPLYRGEVMSAMASRSLCHEKMIEISDERGRTSWQQPQLAIQHELHKVRLNAIT